MDGQCALVPPELVVAPEVQLQPEVRSRSRDMLTIYLLNLGCAGIISICFVMRTPLFVPNQVTFFHWQENVFNYSNASNDKRSSVFRISRTAEAAVADRRAWYLNFAQLVRGPNKNKQLGPTFVIRVCLAYHYWSGCPTWAGGAEVPGPPDLWICPTMN